MLTEQSQDQAGSAINLHINASFAMETPLSDLLTSVD